MIDIEELKQDVTQLPNCSWSASTVLELINRLEAAESQLEAVTQQARIWKMEALAHKSTVEECSQACTGSTGEPVDWHGANPVKEMAMKLATAKKDAFEQAAKVCDAQQLEPECPERAAYCADAIRQLGKEG